MAENCDGRSGSHGHLTGGSHLICQGQGLVETELMVDNIIYRATLPMQE